ncbi:metallophosphoesterase [Elizabethkingia meningoseptica]|uniref:metallophosphoesterase n=1 Tax=Elizabethkingia meningoseptica TaxID=238 RepID=UPI0023AF7EA3|nr:metallophosphoesterase [Elizabethkingia meningoseptica]MDE5491038.1 metallophosphoesterase [Elizabethkingia meningoseptica]
MEYKIIQNYSELNNWLLENYDFEESMVLEVNENPIEITIGQIISGNHEANTEMQITRFKIIPSEVFEFTFDKQTMFPGEKYGLEEIIPLEPEFGIGLQFNSYKINGYKSFKLLASEIKIEKLETLKTVFKPWVSNDEMYITSTLQEIPKPAFWIEKLAQNGFRTGFRYYAGQEKPVDKVPYPDYQGYFIQLKEKIDTTEKGLFFKHVSIDNGNLNITIYNSQIPENMWHCMTKILSDFQGVIIYSGNCKFSGEGWKEYLHTGQINSILQR